MAFLLLYLTANSPKAGMGLSLFFLLFVIYFWLTEFRTRAHKIIVLDDKIIKREYFGLGKEKIFEMKGLEGFNTSIQPGRQGDFEYIFIIHQGRRIASASRFYHRNYDDLKVALEGKIRNLGLKEYKFLYEYKQMFR